MDNIKLVGQIIMYLLITVLFIIVVYVLFSEKRLLNKTNKINKENFDEFEKYFENVSNISKLLFKKQASYYSLLIISIIKDDIEKAKKYSDLIIYGKYLMQKKIINYYIAINEQEYQKALKISHELNTKMHKISKKMTSFYEPYLEQINNINKRVKGECTNVKDNNYPNYPIVKRVIMRINELSFGKQ